MTEQIVKKDNLFKDAFILFAITLIAGLLLGFFYELTKGPIADVQNKAKTEAYQSAFPDADLISVIDDNAIIEKVKNSKEGLKEAGYAKVEVNELLEAKDSASNTIGYVMMITGGGGYGGDIVISMGVNLEGAVQGIQVLTMNETAGLGARSQDPEFLEQYVGKIGPDITYTSRGDAKDNQIAAISGATITTAAVTNAVNAGCYFASNLAATE